jgi:hypothetical protein
LSSQPIVYANSFGAYELAKLQMGVKSELDLTFRQTFIAGFFASLVNVPILTVTEVVKCRM